MGSELKELIQRKVMLFDGGMGTMLISSGLGRGQAPEEWIVQHPEKVREIHYQYLQAGAEVVQTNTFGATDIKLSVSRPGKKPDVDRFNEEAVKLVREAVEEYGEGDRFVAGDIGPTGKFFPPVGTLEPNEARRSFRQQARALHRAGVDLFLVETMYDLKEAVEALRAIREVSDRPVVVEMTFDRKPNGYFTIVGDTPGKAVDTLLEEGTDVVGANCTISSAEMIDLAVEMRKLTDKPLLFQPNAGSPEIRHGKELYRQKPDEFADDMTEIVEKGANAVGGCCGTTPEFIRALHDRLVGIGY
jgi:5-methyltetrahydrofolate--homocysteine methyltransferase